MEVKLEEKIIKQMIPTNTANTLLQVIKRLQRVVMIIKLLVDQV